MNTIILRRGKDGKDYPAAPLSRTERNRARWAAHHAVHRDSMSIRQAQAAMAAQGIRRSIGTIMRDLELFQCPHCPDVNT